MLQRTMLSSSSPVDLLLRLFLFPNRYSATAYLVSLLALSLHYCIVVQLCGFARRPASHLSKDEAKQQRIKQGEFEGRASAAPNVILWRRTS